MGFWSGLGNILKKAAPIAAGFIPGVGPLASMGIRAATGAATGAMGGGGWKGALSGAASGAASPQGSTGGGITGFMKNMGKSMIPGMGGMGQGIMPYPGGGNMPGGLGLPGGGGGIGGGFMDMLRRMMGGKPGTEGTWGQGGFEQGPMGGGARVPQMNRPQVSQGQRPMRRPMFGGPMSGTMSRQPGGMMNTMNRQIINPNAGMQRPQVPSAIRSQQPAPISPRPFMPSNGM